MNIFDIIGPVMTGPSSTHTAGAARLGGIAGKLLGQPVLRADIFLFESFAATGKGHGTDKAIVGGILGMAPDDARLSDSFGHAEQANLAYTVTFSSGRREHPNTAEMRLSGESRSIDVAGVSLGGGRVEITRINGLDVSICADYPTLVVFSQDRSGTVAHITQMLAATRINIASMLFFRDQEGENAVMTIELDQEIPAALLAVLKQVEYVSEVIYLRPIGACIGEAAQ